MASGKKMGSFWVVSFVSLSSILRRNCSQSAVNHSRLWHVFINVTSLAKLFFISLRSAGPASDEGQSSHSFLFYCLFLKLFHSFTFSLLCIPVSLFLLVYSFQYFTLSILFCSLTYCFILSHFLAFTFQTFTLTFFTLSLFHLFTLSLFHAFTFSHFHFHLFTFSLLLFYSFTFSLFHSHFFTLFFTLSLFHSHFFTLSRVHSFTLSNTQFFRL